MAKVGSFLVGALGILLSALALGNVPGDDWGLDEVTDLIAARARQGKPFHSVDELITAFPPGLKSHFTFVYATRNRFQAASFEAPRAIVFGKKLLYAFNGEPSQLGFHTLEMMEFQAKDRRFALREIRFEKGQLHLSARNPSRCLECHGSDPRPLWNHYDQWTGVYASRDDDMTAAEEAHYPGFLAKVRATPESRYAKLVYPTGTEIPPYGNRGGGRDDFRINLLLTQMLTRMNALRVARLFEETPEYARFRWLLPDFVVSYSSGKSVGTNGCPDLRDEILPILETMANARNPHRKRELRLPALVFEAFGLPVDRVSLELGATEYQYADGTDLFLSALRTALLRRLVESNARFAREMTWKHDGNAGSYSAYDLYRYIDTLVGRYEESYPGACTTVGDRADAQVKDLTAHGVKIAPPDPAAPTFESRLRRAESSRASPALPVSCIFCHTGGGDGPSIPFDDESELRKALLHDGGRLRRNILERVAPEAPTGLRMPPPNQSDFAPVAPEDVAPLRLYLESLTRS